jgi:hypothetical protein
VQGNRTEIAAYLRRYQGEQLLILNNLTDTRQDIQLRIPEIDRNAPVDLLSGKAFPEVTGGSLSVALEPYQFYWLSY